MGYWTLPDVPAVRSRHVPGTKVDGGVCGGFGGEETDFDAGVKQGDGVVAFMLCCHGLAWWGLMWLAVGKLWTNAGVGSICRVGCTSDPTTSVQQIWLYKALAHQLDDSVGDDLPRGRHFGVGADANRTVARSLNDWRPRLKCRRSAPVEIEHCVFTGINSRSSEVAYAVKSTIARPGSARFQLELPPTLGWFLFVYFRLDCPKRSGSDFVESPSYAFDGFFDPVLETTYIMSALTCLTVCS